RHPRAAVAGAAPRRPRGRGARGPALPVLPGRRLRGPRAGGPGPGAPLHAGQVAGPAGPEAAGLDGPPPRGPDGLPARHPAAVAACGLPGAGRGRRPAMNPPLSFATPDTDSRRVMALPNFIGLGAQRAATTWIHKCLSEHPEAFVSEAKELNYFD